MAGKQALQELKQDLNDYRVRQFYEECVAYLQKKEQDTEDKA